MMRCPPLCGRAILKKEEKKVKKRKRVVTLEEERIVRWTIDNKEDWKSEEEIEENHRKIKELVPRKFLKWRKVFGRVELERMPTRKVWDYTINLKETFKLCGRKESIFYPKMREKKSRTL